MCVVWSEGKFDIVGARMLPPTANREKRESRAAMSDSDDLFLDVEPAAAAPKSGLRRLKSAAASASEKRSPHRVTESGKSAPSSKAAGSKRPAVASDSNDSDAPVGTASSLAKKGAPTPLSSSKPAAANDASSAAPSPSASDDEVQPLPPPACGLFEEVHHEHWPRLPYIQAVW